LCLTGLEMHWPPFWQGSGLQESIPEPSAGESSFWVIP